MSYTVFVETFKDPFKRRLERAIKLSPKAEAEKEPSADGAAETAERDLDLETIRGMVDPDTWQRITELQREKQDVVAKLRAWRARSLGAGGASPEDGPKDGMRTLLKRDDGSYEMHLRADEKVLLTEGEVFAAAQWGTWWRFDASVPRDMQRRVMTHQVRNALSEMYDRQLEAFGAADHLSDDRKRGAYERKAQSESSLDTMPSGILAEKMLVSCLTKAMYDGDLPFTIETADAYEDIEHKIDFIVTYRDRSRGVKAAEPEHRVGIQFTLDPNATERKLAQLSRMGRRIKETAVDEIVLVTLPISHVRDVFDEWRYSDAQKKTIRKKLDPRGPDRLWPEEFKQEIVDRLVKGAHRAS